MREINMEARMSLIGREEWRRIGNRDVLAKDGRLLTSAARATVDLLATDEEEPPPLL
jgi:hypothetical protein